PVAASAFDGPGPQARVPIGEGHEQVVAVGRRLDSELTEHPARPGVERGCAVRLHVGVDPDHDVDDVGQTVHALLLFPEGRGSVPVRAETGRTVMGHANRRTPEAVKLLIRPEAPTGPGPATTSGQVAPKARSQSEHGSR